jgi:hypothetical protein
MNKVYLLLRNNQQTGPYSLEELTNLPLKPFDLIWVEGKSFGWSYPGEIESLKPYVAEATGAPPAEPSPQAAIPTPEPKPASRKIFVSLPQNAAARPASQPQQQPQPFQPQSQPQSQLQPQASTADMLEQKAEELRKRIQSQAAESGAQPKEMQTHYARSINDVEEEYTSWVFKQKAKKKKTPAVQAAAALLVLGLAGYFGWSMMSGGQETAQPQALVQPTPGPQTSEQDQTLPEDDAAMPVAEPPVPVAEKKKEALERHRVQQQKEEEASTLPQVQDDEPRIASSTVQETASPAPPVAETPTANEAKEESTVSAEPKKERKKIGKAINNVLEKLKGNKQEETVEEAPKSVTGSGGERRAVRRGEDNSVVSEAPNLAAQIKLVASERPANWMMGVVGQKLTLYNLSNQTIRSATVEVLYYNEQDKLLEKKQIQFTNIGPSRTKTVPIPDHRLADHASYKVISASGDEEAYAKVR